MRRNWTGVTADAISQLIQSKRIRQRQSVTASLRRLVRVENLVENPETNQQPKEPETVHHPHQDHEHQNVHNGLDVLAVVHGAHSGDKPQQRRGSWIGTARRWNSWPIRPRHPGPWRTTRREGTGSTRRSRRPNRKARFAVDVPLNCAGTRRAQPLSAILTKSGNRRIRMIRAVRHARLLPSYPAISTVRRGPAL